MIWLKIQLASCHPVMRKDTHDTSRHFSTQAVHAGQRCAIRPTGHPISPVDLSGGHVHLRQTWMISPAALHENRGYSYSRYGSPTIAELEKAVATLEGTEDAVAYASGMGALHGAFAQANITPDRPVVAARNVYGATYTLLNKMYADSGALHFVEISDRDAVKAAIEQHHPRAVVLETISNPLLKIPDIPAITQWAHAQDAIVIIDNTFATPYLYRPIEHGVDVVVHSATKYLGGHGDVLARRRRHDSAARANELRMQSRYHGANLGPFEAWLTLRGIRTLALRMREQCANALKSGAVAARSHRRLRA